MPTRVRTAFAYFGIVIFLAAACGDSEETTSDEARSTTTSSAITGTTRPSTPTTEQPVDNPPPLNPSSPPLTPVATPIVTAPPTLPSDPTFFGWGDLILRVPDRDDIYAQPSYIDGGAGGLAVQIIRDAVPGDQEFSTVELDARTGAVIHEQVLEADRSVIDAVIATAKVVPLDPATAPWPYTGSPPEGQRQMAGLISYVSPPPEARMQIGRIVAGGIGLNITNGWATLVVGTSEAASDLVTEFHGDDTYRPIFERWLKAARLCPTTNPC